MLRESKIEGTIQGVSRDSELLNWTSLAKGNNPSLCRDERVMRSGFDEVEGRSRIVRV